MYPSKLESVIVHLTNACANKCPYCYAYSGSRIQHAAIKDVYRILDELYKADVSTVSFLGGDPVLHPEILSFIEYAYNKGLNVSVMSNTLSFKKEHIDTVVNMVSFFETTIHGNSPEMHDTFCGKIGAYNELVNNLLILSKRSSKIGIAINIIPDNVKYIYSMIKRLVEQDIKISYIVIQRIIQFGRAKDSSDYKLTKEDVNIALEQIDKINKDFDIKITVEDPFPLCVIEEKYHKYMHSCEWGFTKGALNSNGDFSRCGADPRCSLGNIFVTPITEIWEKSPELLKFRNREYLAPSCKKCVNKDACAGGCPLSCENNSELGVDYLYTEFKKI